MKKNEILPKNAIQDTDTLLTRKQLIAIFDSAFDEYYLLISPQYEILFGNEPSKKVYLNHTGFPMSLHSSILDHIPHEYKESFIENFEKALLSYPHVIEIEFFVIVENTSIWLEFHFNPVNLENKLLGIALIIRDVTKKKSNEFALINKNKTLHEYAFLTSHKLRAPLTNILGLSNLIEDIDMHSKEDCKQIKSLFKHVQKQAETLDNIINTLGKLIADSQTMELTKDEVHEIKRIILVDDELIVTMLNSRMIEKVNKNIERLSFNSPKEALKYLQHNKADLILLDINMPEMNAWEFLECMNTLLLQNNVIIVSSSIDPNDRRKAATFPNVKGFLPKPLNVEDLKLFLPLI